MRRFREFVINNKLTQSELARGISVNFPSREDNNEIINEGKIKDYFYNGAEGNESTKSIDATEKELTKEHPWDQINEVGRIKAKLYTRGNKKTNKEFLDAHTQKRPLKISTEHLDAAVEHHTLKKDLSVYRGVDESTIESAKKHPDRIVHHPDYISTTLSPDRSTYFGRNHKTTRHILKIDLKKGQKALPILRNSSYPQEKEVTLPRGHSLKISEPPIESFHNSEFIATRPNSSAVVEKRIKIHVWGAHVVKTRHDE